MDIDGLSRQIADLHRELAEHLRSDELVLPHLRTSIDALRGEIGGVREELHGLDSKVASHIGKCDAEQRSWERHLGKVGNGEPPPLGPLQRYLLGAAMGGAALAAAVGGAIWWLREQLGPLLKKFFN